MEVGTPEDKGIVDARTRNLIDIIFGILSYNLVFVPRAVWRDHPNASESTEAKKR
jgi:hypothetical protein